MASRTTTTATAARGRGNAYQGMNWIRKEKRLAIYLRDGLACVWCGATAEGGAKLALDHVIPYSHGGRHGAGNLVTACCACNVARGTRSVRRFADALAGLAGMPAVAAALLAHIRTVRRRPLDVAAAKALIAVRGGFLAAVGAGR